MKSIIRFSLLCIALICFSNLGMTQKKNKKKATTSIVSKKKKQPVKKSSTQKKKSKKKTSKKKPTVNKKVTNTKYIAPVKINEIVAIPDVPTKFSPTDSTPEKIITIVSAFKPQLKNIAKIGFLNATALVDTNTVVLAYQVPSQNLSFQYQPIALVPRAIKNDSIRFDKQSTQFKIGMGNYFNQLIHAQTNIVDAKAQKHSFSIQNESIAGMHPIQKWNNLALNYVGSLHVNKDKIIHSQVYFDQSKRYRYGLVPDTTNLPLSNFEQKLTVVGANFSLSKQKPSTNLVHYAPILGLRHASLFNQAKDFTVNLNSPIYFLFKNDIKLHTDFTFGLNQYNHFDKPSNQNYFVQLDPSIELNKKQLHVNMGVRPTYSNGAFTLYPKFELTKQLNDTNIVLQAGWKTSLAINQLTQLMTQNHWIIVPGALPISLNESKYFQVAITVNKRLNYGFNMALNDYRELPFFNQTASLNNPVQEGLKFDVLFEKRAIAIELKGDLRYQLSDRFLWKNHFKYIQFNLIRENEQAWGVLPFEFNSQFNWNYNKNLNFDASAQFWSGAKTSTSLGSAYQLNNTFVLNAGMQYALTSNWTFWAKGENLLDKQYQRWANYPSLGVQFIAGVQYKFSKK